MKTFVSAVVLLFFSPTTFAQVPPTRSDDELIASALPEAVAVIEPCKNLDPANASRIDTAFASLKKRYPNAVALLYTDHSLAVRRQQFQHEAQTNEIMRPLLAHACTQLPATFDGVGPDFIQVLRESMGTESPEKK